MMLDGRGGIWEGIKGVIRVGRDRVGREDVEEENTKSVMR